jgi:DNA helicase HerA-like ATPase
MNREYLRVTPTAEALPSNDVATTLASLHKLTTTGSPGLFEKLNPFHSTLPPRFEFLVISEGYNQPVEFYYGADERLETLEARLRSIYPSSFDIERADLNPATKLIQPIEYSREGFSEALSGDQLRYEFSDDERQAVSEEDPENKSDTETWVKTGDKLVSLATVDTSLEDATQTSVGKPVVTEDGTILARPAIDSLRPVGVRWCGSTTRKEDWMTTLVPFTESSAANGTSESTGIPLATLIDYLNEFEQPIAFQVVFQRRDNWMADAELRKENLADGRDTLFQELVGPLLEVDEQAHEANHRELSESVEKRIESISDKDPARTFTVNIRAVSVPPKDDDIEHFEQKMETLRPVFDALEGQFYGVDGKRLRETGWRQTTKEKNARKELKRLLDREITTSSGKVRPDFVLNADELANFTLVPSGEQLSVEGTRGTRAEQQSRNPLPRPHQDLMDEFRDGMAIGHALDENGDPEDEPTHIPPDLLPTHYGRFGTTGSGKSKALINEILSLYDNTDGPVVLVDPKGDGMAENYMRAHARRFGMSDLEENVIHFPIPDILPGFSFFNLEPSMRNGRRRRDAIQRKADHYEEILKLVMGTDRYERATVSPTVIKTLIKALFDEEHGRENGLYRESADYFAHRQLEHAVDQLWDAGPPQESLADAPQSSDEEVVRTLRRQLQLDSSTFSNIMGGVANRLAYISQDTHLRQIFNNTENQFDFRDVLDENTVILFDLGDLRGEAARIMTGVILTNLDDALRERKRDLNQYSDRYVVNLLVDEAASVVVSDIMNDLLEKGRSFRLSVGLSMQFPEQLEAEGGRKVYLNALNNIGSSLVGKINVDQEMAQAMAHEEMDPVEFANRVRSLPRGEWIASLPSPIFGETGPYPFSLKPLPIPAGHPESDYPLTEREEERFSERLSSIHTRASEEFGVPESSVPNTRTPEEINQALSIDVDDLDVAIAKTVRSVQLRNGVREDNEWVSVETVDETLRELYEQVDAEPPAYEELTEIRKRSRLLDTTVDIDADELIVRLTEVGKTEAEPDTGDVRSAGGSDHDDALLEIEQALSPLGFTVSILTQDGSEKPDARATHPDLETPFAVEVETTTPEYPTKVLTNLKKAQAESAVPLFVVQSGETETYWAERIETILSPPVRELANGETRFYTHDSPLTFNGGATEQGGVTAVRSVNGSDDSKRSVWVKDGYEIVLQDGNTTEYLRVSEWDSVTKDRVPATYSYDHSVEEYLVYDRGETHVYESKDAFEAEWATINKPFIPVEELPAPAYPQSSYGIVVLREDSEPVVYEDGELKPLTTLLDGTIQPASPESETQPTTDVTFETFVEECLVEDGETVLPKSDVREVYEAWAERHDHDPVSPSWFSRKLGNHIEFTSDRRRLDGELTRVFVGFDIDTSQDCDTE